MNKDIIFRFQFFQHVNSKFSFHNFLYFINLLKFSPPYSIKLLCQQFINLDLLYFVSFNKKLLLYAYIIILIVIFISVYSL